MPVFPFQCSLRVNIVNGEWPARSCQAYCRAATHLTQTHYSSPQHFHLSFDIAFRSTYTAPSIRFPSVGQVFRCSFRPEDEELHGRDGKSGGEGKGVEVSVE